MLSLAGLVDGRAEPAPDLALVRMVLAGRRAWQVVVADLPPAGGPQVDATLEGLTCRWRWAAATAPVCVVSERRRTSGRPPGGP